MGKNIIHDGYTIDAYVREAPRLYQAMRFKFRPMLAESVSELGRRTEKAEGAQFMAIVAKVVSEQIVEWDETDAKGNPVPVSLETTRRLPYPLLFRLYGIVRMMEPHDEVPQTEEAVDELMAAIANGGSIEEHLRGN